MVDTELGPVNMLRNVCICMYPYRFQESLLSYVKWDFRHVEAGYIDIIGHQYYLTVNTRFTSSSPRIPCPGIPNR